MTIQELGSLGEFLSSLGVMITLIYLIIEVRRNTKASLDTSMQRSFEKFSHVRSIVATNPQLASIVEKALNNEKLSSGEERQIENYLSEFGFAVLYYINSQEVTSEPESQLLADSTFDYYAAMLDNNSGRKLLKGMPFPPGFTTRLEQRLNIDG